MIKNVFTVLSCLALTTVLTVARAAPATRAKPTVDVSRLVPTQPSGTSADHVGVVVFFGFGPASHSLLKRLDQWATSAGGDVVINREPLVTPITRPLARAFMTARTLGITNPILDGLFSMKPDPSDPKATRKRLRTLFKAWGIGAVEFDAAWSAQVTDNGFIRAQTLAERYEVKHVPAIVVDGIWRLTPNDPNATGALVNALADKVNQAALIASENQ